jgi:hyperosmotically inducible protein
MKPTKLIAALMALAIASPVVAVLAAETDSDRAHPKEFVTDSAITTKIKTKLAADHITSLGRIHVDTDKDGVVWLSGTARTQEIINNAIAMARATENVRAVQSDIRVQADD